MDASYDFGLPFGRSIGLRLGGQVRTDTVMINELQVSKSCYFYKQQNPITGTAITTLFRAVRAGQIAPSNNHFCYIRESYGAAYWSAICFQFDRRPAFLADTTSLTERVTGYLLIVEYDGHVAVFKSQLDVPSEFAKRHLVRISAQEIGNGLTTESAVFDRVRLRHMNTSRLALRTKTLEAADLRNAVGPGSSGRFAPLGYSFRLDDEHYTTTPRTGRISQRSDRSGYEQLVDFGCEIIDQIKLKGGAAANGFLSTFARPMELQDLKALPGQFVVDTALLQDAVFELKEIRLVKPDGAIYIELTKLEAEAVFREIETALLVEKNKTKFLLKHPVTNAVIGEIAVSKSRISLKQLNLPILNGVAVERTDLPVGQDPDRMPLRRFIDRTDSFIVLFDEPQYAYIDGSLYQDDSLISGGASFLGYLFEEKALAAVTGEKGEFAAGQVAFDADSTFGVLLATAAAQDDVVVCDDLGNEWADFIGLRTDPAAPQITFYHAKHGALSLGASPFHISVSQAIKNLGNLGLPNAAMKSKYRKWRKPYENEGTVTAISRFCKGNAAIGLAAVNSCRAAPHTRKRVAIVTSSLSKASVKDAFEAIRLGGKANPHFVQLYWLLSSFFASCAEVGAFGCVICQE